MIPVDNELLSCIAEKIAMSGSKGIILDNLWTYLELKLKKQLDTTMKESIWLYLKKDSSIHLHTNTDNNTPKETLLNNYKELSYQQIIEKYNKNIYWIASRKKQDQFLLNNLNISLPLLQRTILEKIGYAGPTGIAQCVITQDLCIKPQTVFHHLKKLQELDLITKHPSIYRGVYTNICIHKRYVNEASNNNNNTSSNESDNSNNELNPIDKDGSIRHDITAKKMTQLLLQAKDNMMTLIDLIRLTGFTTTKHIKWARTFITKQHEDGYVEKALSTANGKRTICVKLIKPLSNLSNEDDVEKLPSKQLQIPSQVQKNQQQLTTNMIELYIENTKEKGCTNKDLLYAFSDYTHATVREVVKKSISIPNSTIVSIKELQGRSHIYRYFSKIGFEQYLELMNLPKSTHHSMLNDNIPQPLSSTVSIKNGNNNSQSLSTTTTTEINTRSSESNENMNTFNKDDHEMPTITPNIPLKNKNSTNITSEYRKLSLLSIIKRDRIREFNQQLIEEIKSMDKSENANRLDRKTIQRLVDQLVKQKEICSIRTMAKTFIGGSNSKVLLLMPNVDDSDQLVKDFLENQQFNDAAPEFRNIPKKSLKEIETTVERYDSHHYQEQQQRKQQEIQSTLETSDYFWRYVAKRHGWMDSKWLRAKELHIYLVQFLLSKNTDEETTTIATINPAQRQISLANIINMLPFELFRKVIGIQLHDNTVELFIEKNNDPLISLYHLPSDIKKRLIPNVSRMRRRIQALLLILEQLGLIEKTKINHPPPTIITTTQSMDKTSNECGYELKLVGHIKNYKLPERPVLMEKPITTIKQVMDFWNELQYTCTCIYSTTPEEFSSNSSDGGGNSGGNSKRNTNDLLASITLSKTWVNGDMVTKEQKQLLDQHVNYATGEVPKNDWQLFLQLSRHTGLLPYRIRSYYVNLGISFDKRRKNDRTPSSPSISSSVISDAVINNNINKKDNNDENTITIGKSTKKRKREMDNTVQLLLEASKKRQRITRIPDHLRKNTMAFSTETGVGSRPLRKKPINGIDEPINTREINIKDNQTKKPIQQSFTKSEHSIFLYAMAIMRYRAQHGKFYWAPIITVLPEKSISQCQSYLKSLKTKLSASIDEITELKYKWGYIYEQGIKNSDLIDERPWDTKEFNLPYFVEYFISQLLEDERSHSCNYLTKQIPYHGKDIYNQFNVVYKGSVLNKVKKKHHSYMTAWSQNMEHSSTFHQKSYKIDGLEIATAIYLIKMIMIEPEESFDPHVAYNLLSQCSENNIEKAFNYLRDIGIVVLSKHSETRHIPGRQFRMSNSFVTTLAGSLPINLYDTAYNFHKQIKNNQVLSRSLQNGAMAALLNLISERKITIKNKNHEEFTKKRSSTGYNILNYNQLDMIWNNDYIDLCIQVEDSTIMTENQHPFHTRKLEWFSKLNNSQVKQHLRKCNKQHAKSILIYDTLKQYGAQGATLMELKIKLQNENVNITDKIIIDTIKELVNKVPPLVVCGGHDIVKYICIEHSTALSLKSISQSPPSSSNNISEDSIYQNDTYLKTSMWCMFDGKTNQNMLYVCATALLGYIIQQPGITNEKLFDIHKDVMSYVEFQQILDHLLKNDIITSRTRMKLLKPSLFSKPLIKLVDLNENITSNSITHYWANKDYYRVNLIKE
ncbi:unnamed protein product [Cunninghamella echinulata]